jgi:hypothetical protein
MSSESNSSFLTLIFLGRLTGTSLSSVADEESPPLPLLGEGLSLCGVFSLPFSSEERPKLKRFFGKGFLALLFSFLFELAF